MKTKIVMITNTFPYSPGEEFLETEINYWAKRNDLEVVIMPKNKTKIIRELPSSIILDDTLNKNKHLNRNNLKSAIKILMSIIFYKEIFTNFIINFKKLKNTLISCRDFLFYKKTLKEYIQKHNNENILFYSYWHTEVCYSLQSLKNDFKHIKVISRIHGFDLYQERRPYNYMPLKKQFLDNIDKIYTISEKAKNYLINTYNYDPKIVEISRLGVQDRNIVTSCNIKEILHVVSCSYLYDIKCIDKIIDSLYVLSLSNPHINYKWTHIGDGKLYEKLYKKANEQFNNLTNINFKFQGHLENKDLYEFYKNNKLDVFINVSQSEGVPVSIMEAMSCHIPIVAPNIGGISDMITDGKNGFLLSNKCSINEIVNALSNIEIFKTKKVKDHSYNIFLEKYEANKNYKLFIKNIYNIYKKADY